MLVLGLVASLPGTSGAAKVRYSSGPRPTPDTLLSEAEPSMEPVVRARGPRVALTNLQLVTMVANVAIERALKSAPLDSGGHVTLAPAESHPLNFVVEHAILRVLARKGITATVRRSVVPDDSLAGARGTPGDPLLEYQLASARITYLRLRGWLPGRVKIERQGLVEGGLTMRDAGTSRVLWTGDASHNLVDAFPRSQLALVEDARYTDLKADVPGRTIDKAIEPVVVVAIVGGLIALFFQNRP
ncbi:MAG: hypothetical protein HY076_01265 [Candidatus Eisenbacteria bacterium]|uniref:Uncharacterized protein n=1 Tax=Eiseniibacteriota bacterium TaxID=2212470 RepID=A0A9D6L4W2_UNCEI|nr:hypothetical protein [Candidatus Eisenbacteria bacterium]MBI3538888.1 hypothetical protein [Candidatus Eisenbacteria bacterium]